MKLRNAFRARLTMLVIFVVAAIFSCTFASSASAQTATTDVPFTQGHVVLFMVHDGSDLWATRVRGFLTEVQFEELMEELFKITP